MLNSRFPEIVRVELLQSTYDGAMLKYQVTWSTGRVSWVRAHRGCFTPEFLEMADAQNAGMTGAPPGGPDDPLGGTPVAIAA